MRNWKVWTAFISVFIAGAIVGAAGLGLTLEHHLKPPRDVTEFRNKVKERLMDRIIDEVQPDESALPAIAEALDQTMSELEAFRKEARPKIKATFARGHARIREHLTPEQRERYDKMVTDIRSGKPGLFRPPHPPPPPF